MPVTQCQILEGQWQCHQNSSPLIISLLAFFLLGLSFSFRLFPHGREVAFCCPWFIPFSLETPRKKEAPFFQHLSTILREIFGMALLETYALPWQMIFSLVWWWSHQNIHSSFCMFILQRDWRSFHQAGDGGGGWEVLCSLPFYLGGGCDGSNQQSTVEMATWNSWS